MKPSTLKLWFGGALAAFIDGFIDGCPVGVPSGLGVAAADGQVAATFSADWKQVAVHVLYTIGHAFLVSFLTGLADLRAWKKDNAFPNIFAPESSDKPTT